MKDVGWPVIIVIASLLGSTIAAIILGTTQVIGFDWLVLILVGITVFCIWCSLRTRQKFQERYNKDIADIKSNALAFKEEEADHWNEWAKPRHACFTEPGSDADSTCLFGKRRASSCTENQVKSRHSLLGM
jgi:hypothetical protein